MKSTKLWVVLGAADGLGFAAVKYLVSTDQVVIAFTNQQSSQQPFFQHPPANLQVIDTDLSRIIPIKKALKTATASYGAIDHIINNADYNLFTDSKITIPTNNTPTFKLIKALLPFLHKGPKGSLINLPPQLCLATIPDKNHADRLSSAMETYLENWHKELQDLDCRLTFLQP